MPWPVLYSRELVQAEDPPGNCLTVFTDLDKLAEHLTALVPEDGRTFDELVYGVKRLHTIDPIELTVATPFDNLKALPVLTPSLKSIKMAVAEVAQLEPRFLGPKVIFPLLNRKQIQAVACHNQSLGL